MENLEEQKELKGTFEASIKRNNKQIREDRALSITEDAELIYKREVEDLRTQIKRLTRERDNMLDLSGNSTTTIISAADFDAKAFAEKDLDIGLKIRNLEIKLEIATKRYNELFIGE